MSRTVDESRPFTPEEREYLLSRGTVGEQKIVENERRFGDLSDKEKAAVTKQSVEDEAKEAAIQEALEAKRQEDEDDSYHPDDVAAVANLTVSQLRQRLEKEGARSDVTAKDKKDPESNDPFTEKEVLAYRLLNLLDEKRNRLDNS